MGRHGISPENISPGGSPRVSPGGAPRSVRTAASCSREDSENAVFTRAQLARSCYPQAHMEPRSSPPACTPRSTGMQCSARDRTSPGRQSRANKIDQTLRKSSSEPGLSRGREVQGIVRVDQNANVETVSKTTLYLDEAKRSPKVEDDQGIYMCVLQQLLGMELREMLRDMLREELRSLSTQAPAGGVDIVWETQAQNAAAQLDDGDVDDEEDGRQHDDFVAQHMKKLATSNLSDTWNTMSAHKSFPIFAQGVVKKTMKVWRKFGAIEAPNQSRVLKRALESRLWNSIVNVVIVLNCAFMVHSVDSSVLNYQEKESTSAVSFWCEVFFLSFYTVEFLLKIANYRQYYFFDVNWKHNILDLVLLAGSAWSVVWTMLASEGVIQNITWLRFLRILRLLKVFRVVELAMYFKTLRAILASLLGSFWTLLWSVAMLGIVIFTFSLVFVSRVATYFNAKGASLDPQEREDLTRGFGSVSIAMESLVMDSLGGREWGEDYIRLGLIGALDQYIFLFFTFLIQIAVMNVILGIFVEDAMKNLQPDPVQKAHNLFQEEFRMETELRNLCKEADKSGTGTLSLQEWQDSMEDGRMREFLEMLGFRALHVHDFFQMLLTMEESGTQEVDIEDFVKGCMRLRGPASSFDMNAVQFEILTMRQLMLKELKMIRSIGRVTASLPMRPMRSM